MTGNISAGNTTARAQAVHYWVEGRPAYLTPLCGSKALSNPTTTDPRYVSCTPCLAAMTPEQRALRDAQVAAYPGDGGDA